MIEFVYIAPHWNGPLQIIKTDMPRINREWTMYLILDGESDNVRQAASFSGKTKQWPQVIGWLDEQDDAELHELAKIKGVIDPSRTLIIEV